MPVCVAAVQGAGGQHYLVLAPQETNISNCTYFVEDGTSYAWRDLTNLTPDQSLQIGTSVGVAWAIAFGFKLILKALRTDEEKPI